MSNAVRYIAQSMTSFAALYNFVREIDPELVYNNYGSAE